MTKEATRGTCAGYRSINADRSGSAGSALSTDATAALTNERDLIKHLYVFLHQHTRRRWCVLTGCFGGGWMWTRVGGGCAGEVHMQQQNSPNHQFEFQFILVNLRLYCSKCSSKNGSTKGSVVLLLQNQVALKLVASHICSLLLFCRLVLILNSERGSRQVLPTAAASTSWAVRQHLQHHLSIYPSQLRYRSTTTVRWTRTSAGARSGLGFWGGGVRFHLDSSGSCGGG